MGYVKILRKVLDPLQAYLEAELEKVLRGILHIQK